MLIEMLLLESWRALAMSSRERGASWRNRTAKMRPCSCDSTPEVAAAAPIPSMNTARVPSKDRSSIFRMFRIFRTFLSNAPYVCGHGDREYRFLQRLVELVGSP